MDWALFGQTFGEHLQGHIREFFYIHGRLFILAFSNMLHCLTQLAIIWVLWGVTANLFFFDYLEIFRRQI